MENQKLLDVVALAAQLQAMACEESGIISVTYNRLETPEKHIEVRVASPEMVDAVSSNARLCSYGFLNLMYRASAPHMTVYTLLDPEEAISHTGAGYEEIVELMGGFL